MEQKEFLKFHGEFLEKMRSICEAKNKDYTNDSQKDAFANFRMAEHLGACSAEIGVLVRMSDKLMRISTFTNNGQLQVKDESVYDTLIDLANYSALLAGLIKSKQKNREYNPTDYV